jgi:hypothetical protein
MILVTFIAGRCRTCRDPLRHAMLIIRSMAFRLREDRTVQKLIAVGTMLALTLVLAGRAAAADGNQEVAPGLKVGDMLDQSNWQLAKGLLPPEILRHYEKGEYHNRIAAAPEDFQHWDASFEEA